MTDIGVPFPKKPWPSLSLPKISKNLKIFSKKPETITMAGTLPKPALRGAFVRYTYRMVAVASAAGLISAAAWHYLWTIPREKRREEFYKNYDPEQHFQELVGMGYFGWIKRD